MIDADLRAALAAAAGPGLLVASDYDGTVSHLVDDPSAAVPFQPAVATLSRLGLLPGVRAVLISGRSLDQLVTLAGRPEGVILVGTHGAEIRDSAAVDHSRLAAVVDSLRRVADDYSGTLLEEKPTGAALHYRHADDPEGAARAARSIGADLGTRIIDGKLVVELMLGDADKGSAIETLRAEHEMDRVVFFGDDTTDEDVFEILRSGDVGVKVGEGASAARFRVAGPEAVAAALAHLLECFQSG